MLESAEILGLIAAACTTSSFVPQVYKTWKTRNVAGISLIMYFVLFIGVVLWLLYGIVINSLSVILANSITGLLVLIILILRIRYGLQHRK
ncbi:SemiSWEET family sugar transporter [Robertkochia solimangrovi]|uniref:SemiSWEET family sugar transporter n=1 Tax=Robertkochia solimangrovi TaxID=2213046 RepID=UPI00117DE3F8|nr:SemiSWEET transporter [Robertkochia solimangrovi]TRZ46286.1 hypothetical protein DMZ48_03250 [Robertkochia solimangrovi]